MYRYLFVTVVVVLFVGSVSAQNLTASEFHATPDFVETFAGGATVGKWELDPSNIAGASPPVYVTSTPGGVNAIVTGLNPVGSSSDGGCMMVGNPSSTNDTLFGLDYIRCVNSLAAGTGEDYTAATFNKYRVVARLYLFTDVQKPERWQVGPFLFAGNLFRACSFYNTNATGFGPGFGYRGEVGGNAALPGTAALTVSGWTLMSVMVDATAVDPAQHRLSICVDANRDGNLNEADPLEYFSGILDSVNRPQGPFGIFTVGEVNSDGFPLFVDTVELYKAPVAAVSDWSLY